MHGIIYFVNGQGCRMFGHRIRAWRINPSYSYPSWVLFFPVMVPEYIDIPVVLLAQKFIDNKIKKEWATQKIYIITCVVLGVCIFFALYIVLCFILRFSLRISFLASYFVLRLVDCCFLFSVVVLWISMNFSLNFFGGRLSGLKFFLEGK